MFEFEFCDNPWLTVYCIERLGIGLKRFIRASRERETLNSASQAIFILRSGFLGRCVTFFSRLLIRFFTGNRSWRTQSRLLDDNVLKTCNWMIFFRTKFLLVLNTFVPHASSKVLLLNILGFAFELQLQTISLGWNSPYSSFGFIKKVQLRRLVFMIFSVLNWSLTIRLLKLLRGFVLGYFRQTVYDLLNLTVTWRHSLVVRHILVVLYVVTFILKHIIVRHYLWLFKLTNSEISYPFNWVGDLVFVFNTL